MSAHIIEKIEEARGCGYRKPGGLYLVTNFKGRPCGKFPVEMKVCPCCGQGIRFARGWSWIDGDEIIGKLPCRFIPGEALLSGSNCPCPMDHEIGKAGLLWIGEKFYKTPQAFLEEAQRMGISRRINSVPKDFKLGKTWVFMGYKKYPTGKLDPETGKPETMPAIFQAFRPTAIEYVVTGKETEKELDALVKRGLTLVRVIPKDKAKQKQAKLPIIRFHN